MHRLSCGRYFIAPHLMLRHSVSSLICMRPLVLLFLAVGTSHRDAVNVKRESVYSITILMHEIGGPGVSVAVASNRSRGCEVCNFGISFCPDYECNTVFSVATEFYYERGRAAQRNFRVTTYRSQATAIWSCAVVCVPIQMALSCKHGSAGVRTLRAALQ